MTFRFELISAERYTPGIEYPATHWRKIARLVVGMWGGPTGDYARPRPKWVRN